MSQPDARPSALRAAVALAGLAAWWAAAPALAADDTAPAARAAASCDDARAREVTAAVQARYDAMRDLSAAFVQSTESVVLTLGALEDEGSEETRGQVTFAKPGRMHWAYATPDESYVVSNGEVIWIYDVGSNQATRLAVAEGYLAGAALQFLLGEGDLAATFEIAPIACSASSVELELRPKQPASYERLGLRADPGSGLVEQTSIVDLFGNTTRIAFEDIRVDTDPPPSRFEFEPPEGAEVVDLGATR